jgi:uncharacterized protein (TIGR02145 family)
MKTTTLSSIILLALAVLFVSTAFTQTGGISVNTDGSDPHSSAILDLQSTQHGLLVPRMTTTQRDAIKTPAEGLLIYNTSTNKLDVYTGAEGWFSLNAISDGAATGSTAPGGGMSVNESGADPHDAAILDVSSTEKGFLLPRSETGDVNSPIESLIIFNTLTKRISIYDGSDWEELLHNAESTTTGAGTGSHTGVLISNTGETAPHHSAMLELRSTNGKGLLVPRMTTDQRNALSPEQGLIVYNTTTQTLNYCTGAEWNKFWACGDNFTDTRDNNVYTTVQIGTQCWMAKNLAYLPEVHSNTEFSTQGTNSQPGYGVYNYDGSDVPTAKSQANYTNYGVLYNWFAVDQSGANAICPAGWHVASDAEWTQLTDYVISQAYPNGTGNALKSCRQVSSPLGVACNTSDHPRWNSHATHHGFDEFGFSALPGGYRITDGSFGGIGNNGHWWSSTGDSSTSAWNRGMHYHDGNVHRHSLTKSYGFIVRCLRD